VTPLTDDSSDEGEPREAAAEAAPKSPLTPKSVGFSMQVAWKDDDCGSEVRKRFFPSVVVSGLFVGRRFRFIRRLLFPVYSSVVVSGLFMGHSFRCPVFLRSLVVISGFSSLVVSGCPTFSSSIWISGKS
jgi:hypothetical protein